MLTLYVDNCNERNGQQNIAYFDIHLSFKVKNYL